MQEILILLEKCSTLLYSLYYIMHDVSIAWLMWVSDLLQTLQ